MVGLEFSDTSGFFRICSNVAYNGILAKINCKTFGEILKKMTSSILLQNEQIIMLCSDKHNH